MKLSRAYSSLNGSIPGSKVKYVPTSGTYPQGFAAAGIFVGVKPGNTSKPDLAIVTSDRPCAAAAVFTKNKFQAAPVTFSRKVLQGRRNAGLRSVVVNSGCANAVTGIGGLEDAARMAKTLDQRVGAPDSTIVMSTGVIGQRYDLHHPLLRPLGLICLLWRSFKLLTMMHTGSPYKRSSTTSRRRTTRPATRTATGSTAPRPSAPPTPSPSSCRGPLSCPRRPASSTASPA